MDNTSKKDVKKFCRICLKIQPHMRFLCSSELRDGQLYTLCQMLNLCTSIQVSLKDEFPDMICQFCINRLYDCWAFKVDCENSEAELQQLLHHNNRNNKNKEETNSTSICESLQKNVTKKNNDISSKVLKLVSVKKMKNNLKIIKGNLEEHTKQKIVENLDKILKENKCFSEYNVNKSNDILITNKNLPTYIENDKLSNKTKPNVQLEKSGSDVQVLNDLSNISNNNNENLNILENSINQNNKLLITRKNFYIKNYKQLHIMKPNLQYNFKNESNLSFKLEEHTAENDNNVSSTCESANNRKTNVILEVSNAKPQVKGIYIIDLTKEDDSENETINNNKTTDIDIITQNGNIKTEINAEKVLFSKHRNIRTKRVKTVIQYPVKRTKKYSYCKKVSFANIIRNSKSNVNFHKKYLFNCAICSQLFSFFPNIQSHLKIHAKHQCSKCSNFFISLYMLKKHRKLCNAVSCKCELCCLKFSSQKSLRTHLKKYHLRINKFFCAICLIGFPQEKMLIQHKKIHEKDMTFSELIEQNNIHISDTSIISNVSDKKSTSVKGRKMQQNLKNNSNLERYRPQTRSRTLLKKTPKF